MGKLILVDITDKSYTKLGQESEINEIKADGKIVVKNPSQKSRLWNLTCDMKEIINTSISSKILNVGSLNPDQEFVEEYEIQNVKEPSLKVKEVFDTNRENDNVNDVFLYLNKNLCTITLTLTNNLEKAISNINLVRELPDILQDVEINPPNVGTASIKEEDGKKSLAWDVPSLTGNQAAQLVIKCTVVPQERDDHSLGSLIVNFLVDSHKLTMVNPVVRCLTDSMSGVTREESSKPGSWDCNVEFINDSEFQTLLEEVKVDHKIPTGTETVVSESPTQEIDPDGSWDFDFSLETPNVPELESTIEFTTLFEVKTREIGEIKKESTIYNVISAEIEKTISPPEVGAYANTEMEITNDIMNKGTSAIETLKIFDEIPPDFVPPELKDIKVSINNAAGSIPLSERQEYIKKIEVDPANQNPDVKHVIGVRLKNLSKEFLSGAEIKMTYPLLAKNPKPEVEYMTPVQIKANTPVKGKSFDISPLDGVPEIKIRYVQRKLKTLKSIKPGLSEGEFDISVRIQNKGDVELENIIVKDLIPAGFELSEYNPPEGITYEVIKKGEKSELEVNIPELKANDSLNIRYNCSGSGDYPRSEPQVVVKGREGAGSAESATESGEPSKNIEGNVTTVSKAKEGKIHDLFIELFEKMDKTITCGEIGNYLEGIRDQLPAGPVLHQLMQYAKEVREMSDKMCVGSIKDEIKAKLDQFKKKYA